MKNDLTRDFMLLNHNDALARKRLLRYYENMTLQAKQDLMKLAKVLAMPVIASSPPAPTLRLVERR